MAETKSSVSNMIEDYCQQLRRRAVQGSLPCAKRTAEMLRLLVTMQRHPDAASLIDDVRSVGYKIQSAKPAELAIGNIVRRVLHVIREEAQQEALDSQTDTADEASFSGAGAGAALGGARDLTQAESKLASQVLGGPGLLSQALKAPGGQAAMGVLASRMFASRALSLSNLLDVGIQESDMAALAGAASAVVLPPVPEPDTESQLSTRPRGSSAKKAPAQWRHKQAVIDAINELIDELDNITNQITMQGVEHLHANEVILSLGMSYTTANFLKEAKKKREFQVVVAEGCPRYDGHQMARWLADAGMQTTVIADAAVFAMMARANKVLVGAHAVLANGGVIAPCGTHMVALAARHFSVPFVVLVGLHKLSPMFPHDPDTSFNEFRSPAELLDLDALADAFQAQARHEAQLEQQQQQGSSQGPGSRDPRAGTLHVPNPSFDYIPPNLISLFITDTGGYTPSYVYRLLTEYYSREDYLLSREVGIMSQR